MENKKITNLEIKGIDELNYTVEALVTNSTLDGDNEIILNSAWKSFDRYQGNPVLMSSHDISSLNKIIGKCLGIKKTSEGIICTFEYFVGEGNAEADWAFVLAKKGIAAYSVGFIAHGYEYDEDKMKELLKLEGIKVGKGKRVRGIITEAELYEVSMVNVPCNPDALMKSKSLGTEEKNAIIDAFDEVEKEIKSIYDKIEKEEIIVPNKTKELTEEIELNKKEENTDEDKVMVNIELSEIVELAVEKAVKAISDEIITNLPKEPNADVIKAMEEKIDGLTEKNAELKSLIVDFEKKFVTIKEEEVKIEEAKAKELEAAKEKELEAEKAKQAEVKIEEDTDLYAKLLDKINEFKI